jgi:hypothetical protein
MQKRFQCLQAFVDTVAVDNCIAGCLYLSAGLNLRSFYDFGGGLSLGLARTVYMLRI